jgi:hypothetical protein
VFPQGVEKIISAQQRAFKQYIRLLLKRNLTDPSRTTPNIQGINHSNRRLNKTPTGLWADDISTSTGTCLVLPN